MSRLEYIWRVYRWDSLQYIWRHELRDLIEGGVAEFYFRTVGIGPSLLGYCLGRWVPAYVRAIPLLFILTAGVWWTLYSGHWFEVYVLGNVLYTGFLIGGLMRKARDRETEFWDLHHFDWITLGIATVLMMLVYKRPRM